MEQPENEKQMLTSEEEGTAELQDPQPEPEAIPLGPDTQAIIIQSIN